MTRPLALASLLSATTLIAGDGMVRIPVDYELDGTGFQGMLIYHEDDAEMGGARLPGIVMIPNWMGPTENAYTKAEMIAGDDFAVFVADMYGVGVRPENASEAGKAAGVVRADREMMRARARKAVEVFHGLSADHPVDEDKTLAIGFCFGGGTVLELARSGIDSIEGAVSFHGDLASPTLAKDAGDIEISLLVLHGADDPYVPQADVQAFIEAMQNGGVEDWTLVQFSDTVHSFTNPDADSDGSRYNGRSAERAFEMMDDFAEALLVPDKN